MFDIKIKELNLDSKIASHILELSKTLVSNSHTNVGGWQHDFISNGNKEPDWLKPIIDQIDSKVMRLWINVNGPGHYNKWHTHGLSNVAVLYVSVPENSGDIEFRRGDETYKITPKVGQLIMFPGTLEHRVLENKSSEKRISIAINLK